MSFISPEWMTEVVEYTGMSEMEIREALQGLIERKVILVDSFGTPHININTDQWNREGKRQ